MQSNGGDLACLLVHLDGICLSRVTPSLALVPAADFRLPAAAGSGKLEVGLFCVLSLAASLSELNSARTPTILRALFVLLYTCPPAALHKLCSQSRCKTFSFCSFGPSVRGVRSCPPQTSGGRRAIIICTETIGDATCPPWERVHSHLPTWPSY
jgi:hypothetical protein